MTKLIYTILIYIILNLICPFFLCLLIVYDTLKLLVNPRVSITEEDYHKLNWYILYAGTILVRYMWVVIVIRGTL